LSEDNKDDLLYFSWSFEKQQHSQYIQIRAFPAIPGYALEILREMSSKFCQ